MLWPYIKHNHRYHLLDLLSFLGSLYDSKIQTDWEFESSCYHCHEHLMNWNRFCRTSKWIHYDKHILKNITISHFSTTLSKLFTIKTWQFKIHIQECLYHLCIAFVYKTICQAEKCVKSSRKKRKHNINNKPFPCDICCWSFWSSCDVI